MKAAQLVIEKVQPKTVPALSYVLRAAARALEQKGTPLWPLAGLEPEALLTDYSQSEMYLGFQNDKAVAGMILLEEDPLFWPDARTGESLFVHKLTVTPSVQGTGMGTPMLNYASARARMRGKRYLRLDCAAERRKLRAFYERHGFCCVGEQDVDGFPTARYELDVGA